MYNEQKRGQVKLLSKSRPNTRMLITVDVQLGKILLAKQDSTNQKFTDVFTYDKGEFSM